MPIAQSFTVAYGGDDRPSVVATIREIAKRHYNCRVRGVRIKDGEAMRRGPFNSAADASSSSAMVVMSSTGWIGNT